MTPDQARLAEALPGTVAEVAQKTGMKEDEARKDLEELFRKGAVFPKGDFAKRDSYKFARDIVQFHEELLLGYVENLRDLAEPLLGPTTQAVQRLLEDSDSLILYGLTERDGDACYISAPLVSRQGVLGTKAVLIGVVGVIAAQLMFTYAPVMNSLFDSAPVPFTEGAIILAVGAASLFLFEGEKTAVRYLSRWRARDQAYPGRFQTSSP